MKIFHHNDLDFNQSMIIYKISNLVNGKVYIGQTIQSLRNRLQKTRKYNDHLCRAIDLYGYNKYGGEQQCLKRIPSMWPT